MDSREKKATAFADLASSEALVDYLKSSDRRNNISFLHHYTSVDVVIKIIRNRLWHLAKAENMNDRLEYESGDKQIWKHLFFSSFMGEDKESIAMWSMYGQPWEKGVKISIPKHSMSDWIRDISVVNEIRLTDYQPTSVTQTIEKNALSVSAIAYTNCHDLADESEETLSWSTVTNKKVRISPSATGALIGYIKNKAWAYEKEFRLMLAQKNCSGFDRVGIEVPDYVIDSMRITPSPLFEGNF